MYYIDKITAMLEKLLDIYKNKQNSGYIINQ